MKRLRWEGKPEFLPAVFLLAPYVIGLYQESLCALAALVLLGWLGFRMIRTGKLTVRRNLTAGAVLLTVLAFGVSALWAVDRGLAPFGFIKFLPLPLFLAALIQTEAEQKTRMLHLLPWNGAVMVLLSLICACIPPLKVYFLVNGRLSGFFQYSNTFALFLLLGIPVLLWEETWNLHRTVCLLILYAGIVLSGSRTVLLLLGAFSIAYIFLRPQGQRRFLPLAVLVAAAGLGVLYGAVTGDLSSVGRILTLSASSSTLNGRILYDLDALPVILSHPFGLGYQGYFYLQGSFQTGFYTVMHVHNELLQAMLDVGWLPAGLMAFVYVRAAVKADPLRRVLLILLGLHCLVDFDLQFTAMGLLMILLLEEDGGKILEIRRPAGLAAAGVLAALCLYLGAAAGLQDLGRSHAAIRLYPLNTRADMKLMEKALTPDELETEADRILSHNQSVSMAWSAKARLAASRLDFAKMIEYKRNAIILARYHLEEYLDYADLLRYSWQFYSTRGDDASAEICLQEMRRIPVWLRETEAGTSTFGRRIYDQPQLDLPAEYEWLLTI